MKRFGFGLLALFALLTACAAGGYAAAKAYQYTGIVKTVAGSTFTVEKSAKETWEFETAKDTKGTPKVGDKVTVYYKMVATEIESKPAAMKEPAKGAPPAKK